MNVTSNMSQTHIKDDGFGNKIFTKIKDVSSFDIRTITFQTQLTQIIKGKFNINKFRGLQIKNGNSKMQYLIDFEYINEQPWKPNQDNMKIIGTSMAHIHNFSYYNRNLINLNYKNELYDSLDKWYLPINKKFKSIRDKFLEKRREYFNVIPRINPATQIKLPLHRDFKPHNILFDGDAYNLIDFDFAAVDFISLEIMAFIVDIIDSGMENIEHFLQSYLNTISIPIDKQSIVTDYINYLCTNTFPFYMADTLDEQSFMNLIEHRDKAFDSLIENKKNIEKILIP